MTDEFSCVCNLMEDDLQKDWYENGEKYSHEGVEAALYKAYELGACNSFWGERFLGSQI